MCFVLRTYFKKRAISVAYIVRFVKDKIIKTKQNKIKKKRKQQRREVNSIPQICVVLYKTSHQLSHLQSLLSAAGRLSISPVSFVTKKVFCPALWKKRHAKKKKKKETPH